MARKPQVRYFASRGAYYCQIDGKQHSLAKGPDDFPDGPTYKAAFDAYQRLLDMEDLPEQGTTARVRAVLDAYLQAVERKVRATSFQRKLALLRLFSKRHGDQPVWAVKPLMIEEFILEMRRGRMVKSAVGERLVRWKKPGIERTFLIQLKAAFAWAVKQQILPFHPLVNVETPPAQTKARERIVTPEEHGRVMASLTRSNQRTLRNIIIALEATGARPGELLSARAGDFDHDLGAIVYYADDKRREDEFAHKSSRRKDRIIYFTGTALAMIRDLCAGKNKTDVLFPNSRGKQCPGNTLVTSFERLRERLGLPHLVPYAYRHTFATRWLMRGGSIDHLAELLGNSPDIIRKHYSHLCKQHGFLRAKLEEFRATDT